MKYFIFNLCLHSLVAIVLIVLVFVFATRNNKRKTKHVLTFFLPVIFAIFAVIDIVFYTGPRLLDISDMMSQKYSSHTGLIEEISYFNNSFVVDGKTYYVNPINELPSVGSTVKVKYTRYAGFAAELELVAPPGVEPETAVIE